MNANEKIKMLANDIIELYYEFSNFQPTRENSKEYLKKCGEAYEVYLSTLMFEEICSQEEIILELTKSKEWLKEQISIFKKE